MSPTPPISTPFPYTTLFRSYHEQIGSTVPIQVNQTRIVVVERRGIVRGLPCPRKGNRNHRFHFWRIGRSVFRSAKTSLFTIGRSEEHTSELQSRRDLVCRLL